MGADILVSKDSHERNIRNKEKKVDSSIVTDIVADSYERMNPENDEITLVRRGLRIYSWWRTMGRLGGFARSMSACQCMPHLLTGRS